MITHRPRPTLEDTMGHEHVARELPKGRTLLNIEGDGIEVGKDTMSHEHVASGLPKARSLLMIECAGIEAGKGTMSHEHAACELPKYRNVLNFQGDGIGVDVCVWGWWRVAEKGHLEPRPCCK